MLLRNINPSVGLCNGTRLIILQLGIKIIEAVVITGSHKGEKVFIPRIVLTYQDKKWPFIVTTRTSRSMTGTREWEYIKYPKPIVSLKNFFAN